MKKVRFTEEQIVSIVGESQAHGVPETSKKHKVSEQTIYLWRKKYGTMEASQVAELKHLQQENSRLKKLVAERDLEIEVMKEINAKKVVTVTERVAMARHAQERGVGQRRSCHLVHVSRSMYHYRHLLPSKTASLCDRIQAVSREHPAWGYRLVHGWLREQGEGSSLGRVRRLWQKMGFSALWRRKHRKIKRGMRINPSAEIANTVWCMDFAEGRLQNGRRFMSLLVKDEATAYGLEIAVASSFKARNVEAVLDRLVDTYGKPAYARCDNGGQLTASAEQAWAQRRGVQMAYIDPGKPWQNGSAESLVGTYRREVLDAEIFLTLKDAEVLSQRWKRMYNTQRPHSRHGYRPPASVYLAQITINSQNF